MKTEEAQQTVTLHSRGDDSYNHAVEALIRDYGSPTILYPYHMRELVTDEVLTYSREGLRRFRERYLLNFQALQDLKGATLSQFLAAHAFDNFGTKLQEEWTKHHASKATIATLEEMAEYFGPLEHRMTVVGSNSTASGQKTAQAGSKTKKPGPPAKSTPAPSPRGQCPLCKETHSLTRCAVFQSYDLDQRNKVVKITVAAPTAFTTRTPATSAIPHSHADTVADDTIPCYTRSPTQGEQTATQSTHPSYKPTMLATRIREAKSLLQCSIFWTQPSSLLSTVIVNSLPVQQSIQEQEYLSCLND